MGNRIEAILFDVGGTLWRSSRRRSAEKLKFINQILEFLQLDDSPLVFAKLLTAHAGAYRRWSMANLIELNESDLWTNWMLPDLPSARISSLALELNQLWRAANRKRRVIPEAQTMVLSLYRRGYHLGLVSNTTSSVEVPRLLDELGLAGCFEAVVLSCQVGKRKPGADILLEATRRMGISPEKCAYVGDRPERDVAAARSAGFGRTVILRDPRKPLCWPDVPGLLPDHFITDLRQLLDIFPVRKSARNHATEYPVYNASLSSSWGMKKFAAFGDFLLAGPRLGFAGIELNHQVRPTMLDGIDLNSCRIDSIHEPCPAVMDAEQLKVHGSIDLLSRRAAPQGRGQCHPIQH